MSENKTKDAQYVETSRKIMQVVFLGDNVI